LKIRLILGKVALGNEALLIGATIFYPNNEALSLDFTTNPWLKIG